MNPRIQSSILLMATLLIGILLGALLQSSLREKRIRHMDFLRSSEGFVSHMVTVIHPTSEQQETQIRAILSEEAPAFTSRFRQHREWTRAQFQEMEERLGPLLDEDQQERLKQRLHPPRRRGDRPEPSEEP